MGWSQECLGVCVARKQFFCAEDDPKNLLFGCQTLCSPAIGLHHVTALEKLHLSHS